MTDKLDDEAVGRVISEVDDWGDYSDIRERLVERFPSWEKQYPKRIEAFTNAIRDKHLTDSKLSWKQNIVDTRTFLAGRSGNRYTMLRDSKGHFFGKSDNINFVTKVVNNEKQLWGINKNTGKKSMIGK